MIQLQASELLRKFPPGMRHEAAANLASKPQFLVVEIADKECIDAVGGVRSIASDHKLLVTLQLQLLPVARSLARFVHRVLALGNDTFQLHRSHCSYDIRHTTGQLEREEQTRSLDERTKFRSPGLERTGRHVLAVEMQKIECIEHNRVTGMSATVLKCLKGRSTLLIDGDDLAVDHC